MLARLVLGPAVVGYDGMFSLVWGRELAEGRMPDLESEVAPTPHPLSNLGAAACSLLGVDGEAVLRAVSFLALGALGVAAFALGRAVWSVPVGIVAAIVVVTRPQVHLATLISGLDVPFLALLVAAAVVALGAERARGEAAAPAGGGAPRGEAAAAPAARRRELLALALLGAAGLLRPEAWPLAALYGGFVAWRDRRVAPALAGLAAPLLWMAHDLVLTGDPLHSLHGTQDLAAELGRPRTLDYAVQTLPRYVEDILFTPLFWAGIAGVIVALAVDADRALAPALAVPVAIAGFLALGIAGLPLLLRYALLPALALSLFAAIAIAGWTRAPSTAARAAWAAGGAALVVWAFTAAGDMRASTDGMRSFAHGQRAVQDSLTRLARTPALREQFARCVVIGVPSFRLVPLLAYRLDRRVDAVRGPGRSRPPDALVVIPANARVQGLISLPVPGRDAAPALVPPSDRPLAANAGDWQVYGRCST